MSSIQSYVKSQDTALKLHANLLRDMKNEQSILRSSLVSGLQGFLSSIARHETNSINNQMHTNSANLELPFFQNSLDQYLTDVQEDQPDPLEDSPIDISSSFTPTYKMSRSISTVKDAREEYDVGVLLGNSLSRSFSIRTLDSLYNNKWRLANTENKFYHRRKYLWITIETIIGFRPQIPVLTLIRGLDLLLVLKFKKSLRKMCEEFAEVLKPSMVSGEVLHKDAFWEGFHSKHAVEIVELYNSEMESRGWPEVLGFNI
jgi:hypothetical protein